MISSSNTTPTPTLSPGREQEAVRHCGVWSTGSTCPWPSPSPPWPRTPFRAPEEAYTLLTQAGHQLRWIEHVRAITPAPTDTTSPDLPTGTPVLITRRVCTDTAQRPIALEETRRSAEDTQLSYPQTPTTD